MAVSTCFVLASPRVSEDIRSTIARNVACFDLMIAHSASEAEHSLRSVANVNFAVLDANVAGCLNVAQRLKKLFPNAPVFVLADVGFERFHDATAVIPHNFPSALAVTLRRELAKGRDRRA